MDEIDGTMSTLEERATRLEEELESVKAELSVSHERNRIMKSDTKKLQVNGQGTFSQKSQFQGFRNKKRTVSKFLH